MYFVNFPYSRQTFSRSPTLSAIRGLLFNAAYERKLQPKSMTKKTGKFSFRSINNGLCLSSTLTLVFTDAKYVFQVILVSVFQ